MAVRSLPPAERKLGSMLGAGVAVALRIVLTFFVAQMMNLPWLHLVGGALILWIAVKVLLDSGPEDTSHVKPASGLWSAMWVILVADITMSLDNVLAVAGASHGNIWLLIFGLGLSIPLVVGASGILSRLMDRYPIIAYLGSAVLGRVGAEMILKEKSIEHLLDLNKYGEWAVQIVAAVGVVAVAKYLMNRRRVA
jgi:YjbE family integral membrane protein